MASSLLLQKNTNPQYHAIESSESSTKTIQGGDIETGSSSSSICPCLKTKPIFRESWPITFRDSASMLVRGPPTQLELSKNVCFESFRNKHRRPSFKQLSSLPMPMPGRRARGYSDDAPILKVKLPMFDAKLSDITWLHKGTQYASMKQHLKKESKKQKQQKLKKEAAKGEGGGGGGGGGGSAHANHILKNHPTVRKFRDQYSNWRKGAAKGASGELTNDRLDGYTVGGEEAEKSDEVELPQEQIKQIEKKILSDEDTFDSSDVVPTSPYAGSSILHGIAEIPPFDLRKSLASAAAAAAAEEEEAAESAPAQALAAAKKQSIEPLIVVERSPSLGVHGVELKEAVLNALNVNFGVTLLVMPYLMKQMGYLFIPMLLAVSVCFFL
jgi:hypothetical protein